MLVILLFLVRLYNTKRFIYNKIQQYINLCISGSFKCADEGEECKCTGSVKYGSGSKWTSERYTDKDTVSCINEVFGDPKPFARKECRCTPAIAGL